MGLSNTILKYHESIFKIILFFIYLINKSFEILNRAVNVYLLYNDVFFFVSVITLWNINNNNNNNLGVIIITYIELKKKI